MAQATIWRTTYRVPNSLPSDTEESVVGTLWHQKAIGALSDLLEEVARRRGATWGVCEQIALQGLQHEDGSAYDPRPDVMVLAQPLPSGALSSIPLTEAGIPLFIAEVASESTVQNDRGDKRRAYEAIGVPEYLIYDPDGDLLHAPLRAWRLEAGVYVPWEAGAGGFWHSASLGVAFEPTQPLLGVRDRDGRQIALSRAVRERADRLEQERAEEERRRIEAERAQVAAEQARAAAEEERAAEVRRRAELEEQLRRLRAQIGE